MIRTYGNTPSDIVKTALLVKVYNTHYIHITSSLFEFQNNADVQCDDLSMQKVVELYEEYFGTEEWLRTACYKDLLSMFRNTLRYNAKDNFDILVLVFLQALEKGPQYVFSRVSMESRLAFQRAGIVCKEAHRAFGFVRLNPIQTPQGEVMVAKVNFQHNVYDIVLRHFAKRFPNIPLYLLQDNQAYCLCRNKLMVIPVVELPFFIEEDSFTELWDAFYDSQYIESRKNLNLAQKHIPKKYWSWMPETKKFK